MENEEHLEFIKTYLPKYLTQSQQEDLFKIIKEDFPYSSDSNKIYNNIDTKYLYQGDGFIDIPFSLFDISKGHKLSYMPGAIMSNSCDISPDNMRFESPLIQFAVIYSLKEYIKELQVNNVSDDRINSFVSNLKENRISNMMFLPEKKISSNVIIEDSFIRFDLNVTLPSTIFEGDRYDVNYKPQGDRLFTFTNYGFYLYLVKLSIHYCRFREGVFRNN